MTLSDKTLRLLACGFVVAIAAAWGDAARTGTMQFASAHSRSVTDSMNELIAP